MVKLYEVFGSWHPSVTPDLLTRIVDRVNPSSAGWDESETPHWNVSAGRLYFAGRLVKQFQRPAPNQRRILDAFQRVHWLRKIDNPFLEHGIRFDAAAEAVRNTAEALNDGHLAEGLIRFGTGGNYSSVYWKVIAVPTGGIYSGLLRSTSLARSIYLRNVMRFFKHLLGRSRPGTRTHVLAGFAHLFRIWHRNRSRRCSPFCDFGMCSFDPVLGGGVDVGRPSCTVLFKKERGSSLWKSHVAIS